MRDITIVVPTLNEVENVTPLTKRIDKSMHDAAISYDLLFIDDHSSDGTIEKIHTLSKTYPVSMQLKRGKRGKAQSIIQGFNATKTKLICMIDADLQYPPEDIPKMVQKLIRNNADVALSQRQDANAGFVRNFVSRGFNLVFIQALFGIKYDTQSGLKVLKKSVYTDMRLKPSQWSFDLEFIVNCLLNRASILTHDIKFGSRQSGEAKVNVIKTSFELAKSSLVLRTRVSGRKVKAAYMANSSRFSALKGEG